MSRSPFPASASLSRPLAAAVLLTLTAGCGPGRTSPPARPVPAGEVLIGYGSQSAENVTGSIDSATGVELHDRRVGRVEELLQGRFPGVLVMRAPGGGFSVRIRGAVGVPGGGEPLYVVDGLPVRLAPGQGLTFINPFDVAHIEVLKDAAAAIYGFGAVNGVILITTRRGR